VHLPRLDAAEAEVNLTTYPDRSAWLAERRKSIGGSDAPAILGLSRWKTPLQVWAEKVGLAEDTDPGYVGRRGSAMETFLATELTAESGVRVNPLILTQARHPSFPCLTYSPDGFVYAADGTLLGIAEFKVRQAGAKDDWANGIPEDVAAQVQHGLDVCNLPAAWVAVDLGTEFRWMKVERDDALIALRRPLLLDFWKLVETETPPEPTGTETDRTALGRLYASESGETIALPPEFMDEAQTLAECEETIRRCETKKLEIENRVRATLGTAVKGVLPDGSWWTWKEQSRPKMVPDETAPRSVSRVLRRGGKKEK